MPRRGEVDEGRAWAARGFTFVEDAVYLGVGLLLAASAIALLVSNGILFVRSVLEGLLTGRVIAILDQTLLVFMIVEILYTVQVSFREHVLVPEPFVLVALIAAVRRILVITAEFGSLMDQGEGAFRYAMIELGLLTVMAGVLVACLVGLRKRDKEAVAERA